MSICLTTMLNVIPSFSQKEIREFNNFIKKNDIRLMLSLTNDTTAQSFWKIVQKSDQDYQKYKDAMRRQTPIAKSTLQYFSDYRSLLTSGLPNDIYPETDLNRELKDDLYNGNIDIGPSSIYICRDNIVNAWADIYGNIFITDSLLSLLDFNYDATIGVLAHEMTHHCLEHTISGKYYRLKKEKENSIAAGIVGGLVGVAGAAAVAYNTYNNVYSNGYNDYGNQYNYTQQMNAAAIQNIADIVYIIQQSADEATIRFGYRYSREQELQSDLIAYRFLQYKGIDPMCLINAFSKINNDQDNASYNNEAYLDHPTTSYRINFLKYLYEQDYNNCNTLYVLHINEKEILVPKSYLESLSIAEINRTFPEAYIQMSISNTQINVQDENNEEFCKFSDIDNYFNQGWRPTTITNKSESKNSHLRLAYITYMAGTNFDVSFDQFKRKLKSNEQYCNAVYNKVSSKCNFSSIEDFKEQCNLIKKQ